MHDEADAPIASPVSNVLAAQPACKLAHEQAWYAKFYRRDLRIIKRWLKRGREKNDPAPLDDPGALVAWWGRCMSYRVPDEILNLARVVPSPVAPAAPPLAAAPPFALESEFGQPVPAVEGALNLSALQIGTGLEVKQAERLVNAAYQRLEAAYAKADENEIRSWSRTWKEANQEYRRALLAEKDLQKARGDLLPLLDATQDWTTLLEVFRSVRRSLFNRIRARLPGVSAEDLEAFRLALVAEQVKEEHVFRTIRHLPSLDHVDAELATA